jgi:hypothetical protein
MTPCIHSVSQSSTTTTEPKYTELIIPKPSHMQTPPILQKQVEAATKHY